MCPVPLSTREPEGKPRSDIAEYKENIFNIFTEACDSNQAINVSLSGPFYDQAT